MEEEAAPVVEAAPVETPEVVEVPQPKPQMVPVGVVADLREKKRGLESENEKLRRELQEAKAIAERLSKDPAASVVTQAPKVTDDVDRRAAELVIQRDIARVNEAGLKKFGAQWNQDVSALTAYGVNSGEFVASVIDIDPVNAHAIMHELAQDGERAIALASMPPARRAAEITRMIMAKEQPRNTDGTFAEKPPVPATPAVKTVSKAPPPPPPVSPSTSKEIDWRTDAASDEEFHRGWTEMATKRWSGSRLLGTK